MIFLIKVVSLLSIINVSKATPYLVAALGLDLKQKIAQAVGTEARQEAEKATREIAGGDIERAGEKQFDQAVALNRITTTNGLEVPLCLWILGIQSKISLC